MEPCQICDTYIRACDPANLVYKSEQFTVSINPRWSPHLGRVAIFPNRHIGSDGAYGLETLTPPEREEFNKLRRAVTDAQIAGFKEFYMKLRDGVPQIDCLVRPAQHPSMDLFPSYNTVPTFAGFTFPSYEPAQFTLGSAPENMQNAPIIAASLPKPELAMPAELRQKISSHIKSYLKA